MKFKKIAATTGKVIATAIAFAINPAFGMIIGVGLFLGFDTFSTENR